MTYETISVEPLSGAIGAEIGGIDLSKPLNNTQSDEIHRAFLEHQVIFFRDQTLTPDEQKRIGRMFGELIPLTPVESLEGHPEIVPIIREPEDAGHYNFGSTWHTDMTFQEQPALASVLYGIEVPPAGGDTLFANMAMAYETLSPGMQRVLQGLTGLHNASRSYGSESRYGPDGKGAKGVTITVSEQLDELVEHPVVRSHPETGAKILYVNPNFTVGFKDMTAEESAPILQFLFKHSSRPEFTCRFRWTSGAVAIWDNRCTQHKALTDYDGQRRVMHRVTIGGDRPAA